MRVMIGAARNKAAEISRAGRRPRLSGIRPAGIEKRQKPAIKEAVMTDFEVEDKKAVGEIACAN